MQTKKLILSLFFILHLLLCFYKSKNEDVLIEFLFFLILNSSFCFIYINKALSLNTIFFIFIYLFFGIAPIIQYKGDILFFSTKKILVPNDFLYGGILVLCIVIVYALGFFLFYRKYKKTKKTYIKLPEVAIHKKGFFIILGITLVMFLATNYFDYKLIFLRSEHSKYTSLKDIIVGLFRFIISMFPVFVLLYLKHIKIKKNNYFEFILIGLIILFNFPTGISRYELAIVYFPLLLTYFNFFKKYFKAFFFFGLLIIFPYTHNFRYSMKIERVHYNFLTMFGELHFDTFQNTLSIIKLNLITYGDQLISCLLFFIPRSIWSEKAIPSATMLCQELEYGGFCNIAISFFGEGFLNFGYVGVLLFILTLSFINARLDISFINNKGGVYFKILFIILLFHEFYMLRGSFSSSYIKLVMILISFIIFLFLKKYLFNEKTTTSN